MHPPTELALQSSILGDISETSVQRIVRDIETIGFHVFDRRLPEKTIRSLYEFAEAVPSEPISESSESAVGEKTRTPYRKHTMRSPRYDIAQPDILESSVVQQLLMDPGLHCIAQSFLRCSPILDSLAMWWSSPFDGNASSEAAQLFHFDMDRIKFLKFFFYLTDVTAATGPHCYVRGSSKRKPAVILRDGRIPDEEIYRCYSSEEVIEICGEAGSIIAVDTRGLHKGKPPNRGERLILQFEYTNSMFGQNYPKAALPKDAIPQFQEFVRAHPRMFEGIIDF